MNTLLRWSFAATVLALSEAALAQSSGEQTPPSQEQPPQRVTFGVLPPFEAGRNPATDASEASANTADNSTNGQNRLVGGQFFRIDGAPPGHLNHPPPRGAVRAALQQRHPDLAEAVGINASTAEELFDLLTEHQLSTLATGTLSTPHASSDWVSKEADAAAKRLEALRGLLGAEGLERYLDYSTTLRERKQVSTFDARLPSEHKLSSDQRQQMIALYQEDSTRQQREPHTRRFLGRHDLFFSGLQTNDLQRAAQLATIAANEEHLRAMPQSHRWFLQRAAEFLTTPQLAALSKMHAARENSLRQWIETARLEARGDPVLPERPVPADEQPGLRTPLAVQMRVDIKLTVNRNEPTVVSHVVANGETVTFEASDGLLVEATSTLHDDDSLNVHWAYYEQRSLRKRRLTDITSVSTLSADGAPRDTENFTVATGSKVYAIRANVSVAAL